MINLNDKCSEMKGKTEKKNEMEYKQKQRKLFLSERREKK
jgi:hypothetical protein